MSASYYHRMCLRISLLYSYMTYYMSFKPTYTSCSKASRSSWRPLSRPDVLIGNMSVFIPTWQIRGGWIGPRMRHYHVTGIVGLEQWHEHGSVWQRNLSECRIWFATEFDVSSGNGIRQIRSKYWCWNIALEFCIFVSNPGEYSHLMDRC